jgi:hypothetical protein
MRARGISPMCCDFVIEPPPAMVQDACLGSAMWITTWENPDPSWRRR